MRTILALIALCGLVCTASARVLVYRNVYKTTFEYTVNTETQEFEKIQQTWNELYVLEIDDETGAILNAFAYSYGIYTDPDTKFKEKWAEADDFSAEDFFVAPFSAKQAALVIWGSEPNLAKLKDGIVVSATGAFTEVDHEGDWLYVCADTTKLRLDSALTKKAQAAFDAEDNLDDVIPVIEAYLESKGYELND